MHQPVEQESRVIVLKLANGETVVGNVVRETTGFIELTNPFKIVVIPTSEMTVTLSILKWDMTIDFDYPVRVFKNTIVACGKPSEKMESNYIELVESGYDANQISDNQDDDLASNLEEIEDKIRELLKQSKLSKLH